jgi:glycerate kinase
MRILVASDKWKGSLSAPAACAAMRRGLQAVWPAAEILERPIADGGEGTAEALAGACGGQQIHLEVTGPLGSPVQAGYALLPDGTAVIEMAAASGLALTNGTLDPWQATTRGVGELMVDAARRGAQRIIVGLGGSATNDGGAGMAAALGWKFDALPIASRVVGRPAIPWSIETLAACDVTNPLLGPRGCTRVFGPQKGVSDRDVAAFEEALASLASGFPPTIATTPGAGAAGGLGFGLMAFCGATIVSGFGIVADLLRLEETIASADLVVTGEGSLDDQTLDGKGPHGVATLAHRHGRPVVGIGGRVAEAARPAFSLTLAASPTHLPVAQAMRQAPELIKAAILDAAPDLRALVDGGR